MKKFSNSYLIVSSLSITKYSHGWLIDFSQQVLPFRPGVMTKASKTWNFFRWRVRYLSFSHGQSRVKIVEMGKWEKAKKNNNKTKQKTLNGKTNVLNQLAHVWYAWGKKIKFNSNMKFKTNSQKSHVIFVCFC